MSSYGPHKDSPNAIIRDANTISVELSVTGSIGTISWSIPKNINSDAFLPDEYDGILLVVDTKPIELKPANSKFYQADTTVDTNKHVGDKLDSGLVVAALYNDKKTNSVQITDLLPNTNYYVAAFASDNVRRYGPGVFSYSIPYEQKNLSLDTAGYHKIKLGVLPDDATGLTDDTTLKVDIDGTFYTMTIPPSIDYADLIDQFNLRLAMLSNPFIISRPPNTNSYTVIGGQLAKWNGSRSIPLECYFGDTSPDFVPDGTYWYSGGTLWQWSQGSWTSVDLYKFIHSVDNLVCGDVWYDPDKSLSHTWTGYSWSKFKTYVTIKDPSLCITSTCKDIWFNGTDYYKYKRTWNKLKVFTSTVDPITYYNGYYWYHNNRISQLVNGTWTDIVVVISETEPTNLASTWYKPSDNQFRQSANNIWVVIPATIINVSFDVLIPSDWYWYDETDLHTWDETNNDWVVVTNVLTSATDPNLSSVKTNEFWLNGTALKQWDGSQWVDIQRYINQTVEPTLDIGMHWYDGSTFRRWDSFSWETIDVITSLTSTFTTLTIGQFWFDTSVDLLSMWNGTNWVPLMYSPVSVAPDVGTLWYDMNDMRKWNGSDWIDVKPKAIAELINGDILFSSTSVGSKSKFVIYEYDDANSPNTFNYTSPVGQFDNHVIGTDHVSTIPLYKQVGVGTDGTQDERRAMANNLLMYLGYPSVQVELDKAQVDFCIDMALTSFRKMSSSAYERAVFFLDLEPNKQQYFLTDGTVGLNKIVDIQAVYRRNSSFMSASAGNGIYAQQFLQWLYAPSAQMDLTSYHIISQYIETMEILFAVRLVHRFNERSRRLDFYQNIGVPERVLVDCTIERTEQELFTDRMTSKWILNWACAEASHILANIRGKYSSVPGAGGSVTMNAGEMQARADALFERCHYEIDNYIANEPENIGLESTLVWG
jgi:hypothetical protein